MNAPNKVKIQNPISLFSSKIKGPANTKISPILIGYCGFNFNSYFIVLVFGKRIEYTFNLKS